MATWVEDNSSRSATFYRLGRRATSTYTKSYKVFGYTNDVDLQVDVDQKIQTQLRGFQYPGTGVQLLAESYSISYLGDDAWQVTINYEKDGADNEEQTSPLKRTRSFDTSGGTQHITQAIKGAGTNNGERRWGANGENWAPPADFAIGVDGDSVAGVDIVVPQLTWTETYDVPSTYVTNDYIKKVAELTGTINNAAFRTFKAGEVLFLGASGSHEWDDERGNGPWSLSFKFSASPNAGTGDTATIPPIEIGTITGIQKRGHDYLWVYYSSTLAQVSEGEPTDRAVLKTPKYVYVNKVYRDGNFALLGIGVT